MQLLSALITALSFLLPVTGREVERPVGLQTLSVAWAATSYEPSLLIHSPADSPSPFRLLIEGLDETALGEQESNEVGSSTAISQIVFGEDTFPTLFLSTSSPQLFVARQPLVFSILRC